ncbi:hypothetical protein QC762_603470 [Podospora pseudocomata]|uniref:HNH nuclease domain-containing protein n=1 Tax=Podospora pseudocomata TaxID=2093779 RepID=A0ABR0G6T7_9PEZI|nr:hypothetical protein QC762_603470 [Podospora pseudocomata]
MFRLGNWLGTHHSLARSTLLSNALKPTWQQTVITVHLPNIMTDNAINLRHECKNADFVKILNSDALRPLIHRGRTPECTLCTFLQQTVVLSGIKRHGTSLELEIRRNHEEIAGELSASNQTGSTTTSLRGWISDCEQQHSLQGSKCRAAAPFHLDSSRVVDCAGAEPTLIAYPLGAGTPWATRGWTYPEGVLSKRRLVFTKHQLIFQCQKTQFLESPLEVLGDHIEQYVARNFTASTDGLDALRGVLQRYKADEDPPPTRSLWGARLSSTNGTIPLAWPCPTTSRLLPELDLAWVEDGEEDELVSLIGST